MLTRLFRKDRKAGPFTGQAGGNGKRPIIQMRKIIKTFSNPAGDFTVLKGIDADFYGSEFVGIIGKSGSGKSTLVNMITGIDRPTSGEIFVGDVAVHELTENELAIWRGRQLGIVFQFFQLLPMLSLLENVMLPMDFCKVYTSRQRRDRAMELLEMMDMHEHALKLPTEISGGQQQRVAIARALANDPPIVLADEPTGNLDSRTSEVIFRIFEDLVRQGKTVVMVTHDSSLARRVSRTLLIADGEIVNEYVARAMPLLSHQQMLKATHMLEPMHFEPGATILREGSPADRFYIVTKGRAEVALQRPGGGDVVVFRPGVGEYFGEVELLRGGGNIATVRSAPETPVDIIALDRNEFIELLSESEETRSALESIVERRLTENITARQELPEAGGEAPADSGGSK
jgi:ABC-type lipoprotein export system ATPase subunit